MRNVAGDLKHYHIGPICIGHRHFHTKKFHFFYKPLLECNRKPNFWFFYWFGHRWYACWPKKKGNE